nr:MFS transporter [Chromobacterium sp. ASV5]
MNSPTRPSPLAGKSPSIQRRALLSASGAHAVHDGMTDLVYVLLPIWQSQFGISYAMAGLLRGLYSGTMAGLQIPASRLAKRLGRAATLALGTALAGLGYLLAGQAGGAAGIAAALLVCGCGASAQHPLASALVAETHHGAASRQALAHYNFAGDVGKMLLPAAAGVAMSWLSWRDSVSLVGSFGLLAALLLALAIPRTTHAEAMPQRPEREASGRAPAGGFAALLGVGVIDSAVRMGFLTFLPFILKSKGAGSAGIGLALSLLFVGGAAGKLACGYLGNQLGMFRTVCLTEAATALAILAALWLPLTPALAMLPLLGVALNGTSSVLYGAVPDLVPAAARERAFARFYTGTIGGGALAPILFGLLGDHVGIPPAMRVVAALALATLPLASRVRRALA